LLVNSADLLYKYIWPVGESGEEKVERREGKHFKKKDKGIMTGGY